MVYFFDTDLTCGDGEQKIDRNRSGKTGDVMENHKTNVSHRGHILIFSLKMRLPKDKLKRTADISVLVLAFVIPSGFYALDLAVLRSSASAGSCKGSSFARPSAKTTQDLFTHRFLPLYIRRFLFFLIIKGKRSAPGRRNCPTSSTR